MSKYDFILAKSPKHGKCTLTEHLLSVKKYAVEAAQYAHLDISIAEKGALLHDIGKASPLFQKSLKEKRRSNPLGIKFRHEIASLFFLDMVEEDIRPQVIDMIVAHHKSTSQDARELGILDLDKIYGKEAFNNHALEFETWSKDAICILVELGFEEKNITLDDAYNSYLEAIKYCKKKKKGWSVWKGLLVGADHLASAVDEVGVETQKLFQNPDVSFYNRQSSLYPLSLISSDKSKKHTFVKAPTGAGKTDFLLKRCAGRIFYTLPFQASINAMYERIKSDLKGKTEDIRLLHSISQLVINKDSIEEKVIQNKFGSSIKILTPHQMAAIVFGIKGYETILFDLKGCDIILDEIHTYSDITQSIVLKIVEILNNIGCRIHVGTATMPTSLEKAILNILGTDSVQYVELPSDVLDTFDRHIIHKADAFEDLFGVINNAVNEKQKILIVNNRVANAQKIYEQVCDLYSDIPKMLIHSRFKRQDRNDLEHELKDTFNVSTDACIVVSTQVVEVSLDISFDLMITETAPIDALIQRFGRINRKRNIDTIGKYKPVYVIKPPTAKADCLPYSLDVLEKSFEVLPDNEIFHERDVQQVIDKVYPDIQTINIDLGTIFNVEKGWRMKELKHMPKSALFEHLDVNSVSCIIEKDETEYYESNTDERILMEIPINYMSIRYKNLRQLDIGTHPFVAPDMAYSDLGLDLKKADNKNYDINNQIL